MKIRTSPRGVVLAVLVLGLAVVAGACVPVRDPGPPAGSESWKQPRKSWEPTWYGTGANNSWTLSGCTMAAASGHAYSMGGGATTSTGSCSTSYKAGTTARVIVDTVTSGAGSYAEFDIYECSTLSGKCINQTRKGTYGQTIYMNHWITNGNHGRYASIDFPVGVDIWFNHTRHVLVTPNDGVWVRYLVPKR